jgi:hypothetical protein
MSLTWLFARISMTLHRGDASPVLSCVGSQAVVE